MNKNTENKNSKLSKCTLVQSQINKYLLGADLSAHLVSAIENHIVICKGCSAVLQKKQFQLESLMNDNSVKEDAKSKTVNSVSADVLLKQLTKKHDVLLKNKIKNNITDRKNDMQRFNVPKPNLKEVIQKTAPKNNTWKPVAWTAGGALALIMMSHALSQPDAMLGKKVIEVSNASSPSKNRVTNIKRGTTLSSALENSKVETSVNNNVLNKEIDEAESRFESESAPDVMGSTATNASGVSRNVEFDNESDRELQAIRDAAPIRQEKNSKVVSYVFKLLKNQLEHSASYNPEVTSQVQVKFIKPENQKFIKPENEKFIKPENQKFIKPENEKFIKPENEKFIKPENQKFIKPENEKFIKPENQKFIKPENEKFIKPEDSVKSAKKSMLSILKKGAPVVKTEDTDTKEIDNNAVVKKNDLKKNVNAKKKSLRKRVIRQKRRSNKLRGPINNKRSRAANVKKDTIRVYEA